MYFKGFDANLCGWNNYQFAVGQVYEKDDWNDMQWFHYTKYVSSTIEYFDAQMRVCEVEPHEDKRHWSIHDGYGKGYYTAKKLRIVRELSRDEIFDRLQQEKCPILLMLKLNPPFEVLLQNKSRIRGQVCYAILDREDLSNEEKRELLPLRWHRLIVKTRRML